MLRAWLTCWLTWSWSLCCTLSRLRPPIVSLPLLLSSGCLPRFFLSLSPLCFCCYGSCAQRLWWPWWVWWVWCLSILLKLGSVARSIFPGSFIRLDQPIITYFADRKRLR